MARLTNADVNRMSLGDALAAQDAITDWDRAHIASHKRMRSAGLGQTRESAPVSSPVSSGSSQSKVAQLVTPVNQKLSAAMAPFGSIIDAAVKSPPYYPQFKDDFKRVPIDALVGLFRPLDNFFYDVVNNSNAASSVKAGQVRRTGLPGRPQVDFVMGLDVPSTLDPYAKDYTKRLKAINNFLILSYQDPAALAKGIVKTIIDDVNAGRMEAQAAVDNLVTLLKNATSAGVNLRALSGVNEGIVAPDDRFLKAVAKEVKAQLPNLPSSVQNIIGAAKARAEEVTEVATFFANYLSYLMGKIGVAIPGYGSVPVPGVGTVGFPFDYWAAVLRVQKDNGDAGVKWEINNVRNNMLRPLREKGDRQGWRGPVYNSGLKWLLDMVWSELDNQESKVSDLMGKYGNGGRITSLDSRYNLVKAAMGYGSPTTFLNPSSQYSRDALKFIRDTVGIPAVVSRLIGDVNATLNQYRSVFPFPTLPANARLPGLAGIPMDTYTFKGLGALVWDDLLLQGGILGGAYGGAGAGNGATAAGGTGVATSPATTPEISTLINQILGMYTGGAVSAAPAKPIITSQPQSVSVKDGEKATFTVVANLPSASPIPGMKGGAPAANLTYQWAKNGAPIAGATSASLLVDATLADSGAQYTVTVGTGAAPAAAGGAATPSTVVSNPATLTVTTKEGKTVDTTAEKKSSILPLVLGAGAVAALPVAGPLAALALGAGAIATAMRKPAAPAPAKPLSGYAGLYGYLGVTSMDRVNRITTAMNVPAKSVTLATDTKSQSASPAEEKSNTALYVAGGLSVAGLILAAAYKKKK